MGGLLPLRVLSGLKCATIHTVALRNGCTEKIPATIAFDRLAGIDGRRAMLQGVSGHRVPSSSRVPRVQHHWIAMQLVWIV